MAPEGMTEADEYRKRRRDDEDDRRGRREDDEDYRRRRMRPRRQDSYDDADERRVRHVEEKRPPEEHVRKRRPHEREWRDRRYGRDWEKTDLAKSVATEHERKMKELEDARRDDMTVLVANISLRATEQNITDFFNRHAGKVRAVKLIKDSRSGKSKGIGYVEFDDSTAVLKSLGLTGQVLLGQPVRVQASQAEKNRAARAAKAQQDLASAQAPTKLYIGGLIDELADFGPTDLRLLFSPFGTITNIDVPKDRYTKKNKGYAFVQYADSEQARDAMLAMHGFEIEGKQIKVGFAALEPKGCEVRSKIAEEDAEMNAQYKPVNVHSVNSDVPLPAHCSEILCLENAFAKDEVCETGLDVIEELEEDVSTECLKFGIIIDLYVDTVQLDGKIYIRFATMEEACEAYRGLHGRYFGCQETQASFIDPIEFNVIKTKNDV